MRKRDRSRVNYRSGECCFCCVSFMRPETGVLGICTRVQGQIHPAHLCDLFEEGTDVDDDGSGRPDDRNPLARVTIIPLAQADPASGCGVPLAAAGFS